jgi:hypothetical protein
VRDASTVLTVLGAVACWYFVVVYHWTTRGDWRRTPVGRHLMAFTANLGALFVLIVVARLWPDYPLRPQITLVFFAAVVAQLAWRCVLLHRYQHRP